MYSLSQSFLYKKRTDRRLYFFICNEPYKYVKQRKVRASFASICLY